MPSTVKKKTGAERSNERSSDNETAQAGKSYLSPSEWAKEVIENLAEAQQTGLELAARQNEIVLEAMTEGFALARAAPTPELREWARQGVEGLFEAQKKWTEIVKQQSDQILQAVKGGIDFDPSDVSGAVSDYARQGGRSEERRVGKGCR